MGRDCSKNIPGQGSLDLSPPPSLPLSPPAIRVSLLLCAGEQDTMGLDPGLVVVIEDSHIGLTAAKAAGMNCLVRGEPKAPYNCNCKTCLPSPFPESQGLVSRAA